MQALKNYVRINSSPLFNYEGEEGLTVNFDSRGFSLSEAANTIYQNIKNEPHLYVAWSNHPSVRYYIGKSNQTGGRWKKSHAYHLGTLAYHFLNTTKRYDQNHLHWIENWMLRFTFRTDHQNNHSIKHIAQIQICFIPFITYSGRTHHNLDSAVIKDINTRFEQVLIQSYLAYGFGLLNVSNNRVR